MTKPTSNRYRILNTIRKSTAVSRIELASMAGLSRAALTGITQSLLDSGLIVEKPAPEGTDGNRGRPRIMLSINSAAGYVMGIKLSLHQMSFSITDFCGTVIHNMHLPFRGSQSTETAIDVIQMGVQLCLEKANMDRHHISGICVGIPGYVSHETGMCHWSPVFLKRDIPFAQLLKNRLNIEVFIENDANLVALAEHWFGRGKNLPCFAVVTVEHGIGMGFVVNDKLYRGANGIGPEFGHSKIVIDGRECRCGQQGCIEAYASDYAILREAEENFSLEAYNENPKSYHEAITRISDQARKGDPKSAGLLEDAGKHLGHAVANMIATLNPPTVIFTGDGMRAGDALMGPALAEAKRLKLTGNHFETEFISHIWGDEVWARGAAALTLEHIYANPCMRVKIEGRPTYKAEKAS